MVKWLKTLKWSIRLLLGLGLIIGILVVSCVVCREETTVVKEGWVKAPMEETSTIFDKLNPFTKTPKKADVILKEWPRGTKVIEIEPQEETIQIAIPPSGEVLTPEGVGGVTVYKKPERDWGLEVRPFVGVGYAKGLAGVGGVDLFKVKIVKPIHVGPAIAYNGEVSGGGSVGVSVWRNFDVRGYVGANLSGQPVYGGVVAIGIE